MISAAAAAPESTASTVSAGCVTQLAPRAAAAAAMAASARFRAICVAPIGLVEEPKHRHGTDGPRLAIKAIDMPNPTSTAAAVASPKAAVAGTARRAAIATSRVIRSTAPVLVKLGDTTFSFANQSIKLANSDLLRTFDRTETEKTVAVMTRAHNSR
jgi:hypothetical protein